MKPNPILRALVSLSVMALLVSGWAPSAGGASGNPPELMGYQGFLTDANGLPLGNTNTGPKNYDVLFRIWDNQGGGNELWAEQQTVTVDKGYFTVLLGEGSTVGAEPRPNLSSLYTNATASDRYIEMTVKGIGAGSPPADVTILPRLRLLTSPYAFLARNAVNAGSLVNGANGQVVTVLDNLVGVNKANPSTALDVTGTVTTTGLAVNGAATANSLTTSGSVSAGGNLSVAGSASANSLSVSGAATVSSLTVNGTATAGTFAGDGTIPLGGIIMWSGATAPTGWAVCDGGTYNGMVTPDLRGRFILASGNGSGLSSRTLGQKGGEETHTLTVAEMPAHTHPLAVNTVGYEASWNGSNEATAAPSQGRNNGTQTWTPSSAGGGQPHNNMPPYYVLAFIMRVQ